MCELFGICAGNPVPANFWLKEFFSHSSRHPNGWGLAILDKNLESPVILREAVPAWKSSSVQSLLSHPLHSSRMIAHIRLATCGSVELSNCHPFRQKDISEREWILAHNGTVFHCPMLENYRREQTGSTDSERILLKIIAEINKEISRKNRPLQDVERFLTVESVLTSLAPDNKLNLLISDGDLYYVFTNCNGCLYQLSRDDGQLFATVPLDDSDWKPVRNLKLHAFRNGQQVMEGKGMKQCCLFDGSRLMGGPFSIPLRSY